MVRGRPQTSISKLTVVAIVLGAICSGVHAREHNQRIWPGKTWSVAKSPEAAGWSSEKLAVAKAYGNSIQTSAVMIVQSGQVVDAPAFRRAASEPLEQKLAALIAPSVKLPGVEAATGSTLIHFMHPNSMPIIDVRTCEFYLPLVSSRQTGRT